MIRLLVCLLSLVCLPAFGEPTLRFVADGRTRVVGLAELRGAVPEANVALDDPAYGQRHRYRALPLAKVLDFAFGPRWREPEFTEVLFAASDGYTVPGAQATLAGPGGYLAFADLDHPQWAPLSGGRGVPGPFYVVWTGAGQTSAAGHPWPWQLERVELVRFADRYPAVFPAGVAPDSPVHAGFLLFKARCFGCHALDRQGGSVGPDLGAPQAVTDYRSADWLRAYIRQPSRFRYTHMPDHTDLSDAQLDALIAYLRNRAAAIRLSAPPHP